MAEVKPTFALTRRGLLSRLFKAAGPAYLAVVNTVAPVAAQLNEPGAQGTPLPAAMQQLKQQQIRNIFDVASHIDSLPGSNAAAFKRIFRVTSAQAQCNVGPELAAKYKVQQDNEQHVVSVTNMHSLEQTWYNQARTTKPQTFNSSSAAAIDPTNNGANCDFCACKEHSLPVDLNLYTCVALEQQQQQQCLQLSRRLASAATVLPLKPSTAAFTLPDCMCIPAKAMRQYVLQLSSLARCNLGQPISSSDAAVFLVQGTL
jgi:hypothetical protein